MGSLRLVLALVAAAVMVAVTGCAELDQLRAENHRLDAELQAVKGRTVALEGEKAQLQAAVDQQKDDLTGCRAEVDLWKGKYETLEATFKRLGGPAGISPELQRELQRLAMVDPNIRVKQTQEGFVVEVGSDILFDSGRVTLKAEGQATIKRIADVVKQVGTEETLRIDGHTDNEPIRVSGWKDNRHLSLMRAHAVLKALEAQGISPERMFAAGFSLYRPEGSNDTAQGRRLNRRVEILFVPKTKIEPLPVE